MNTKDYQFYEALHFDAKLPQNKLKIIEIYLQKKSYFEEVRCQFKYTVLETNKIKHFKLQFWKTLFKCILNINSSINKGRHT